MFQLGLDLKPHCIKKIPFDPIETICVYYTSVSIDYSHLVQGRFSEAKRNGRMFDALPEPTSSFLTAPLVHVRSSVKHAGWLRATLFVSVGLAFPANAQSDYPNASDISPADIAAVRGQSRWQAGCFAAVLADIRDFGMEATYEVQLERSDGLIVFRRLQTQDRVLCVAGQEIHWRENSEPILMFDHTKGVLEERANSTIDEEVSSNSDISSDGVELTDSETIEEQTDDITPPAQLGLGMGTYADWRDLSDTAVRFDQIERTGFDEIARLYEGAQLQCARELVGGIISLAPGAVGVALSASFHLDWSVSGIVFAYSDQDLWGKCQDGIWFESQPVKEWRIILDYNLGSPTVEQFDIE